MELIARSFATMELKLGIIQLSESQSNLLQSNYEKNWKELEIRDPKTVIKIHLSCGIFLTVFIFGLKKRKKHQ